MITTSRLFVRHLTELDYSAFSALENDPDVKKFCGGASRISEARYTNFVRGRSDACMAVCAKNDGRFIGRCGFRRTNDRVELEIFLLPTDQGHGFGPELFDAMISYCFTSFPGSKVAATVSPANSRAINLLKHHDFNDSGEWHLDEVRI